MGLSLLSPLLHSPPSPSDNRSWVWTLRSLLGRPHCYISEFLAGSQVWEALGRSVMGKAVLHVTLHYISVVRRASTFCGYHLSLQVGLGHTSPQDTEGLVPNKDKESVCLRVLAGPLVKNRLKCLWVRLPLVPTPSFLVLPHFILVPCSCPQYSCPRQTSSSGALLLSSWHCHGVGELLSSAGGRSVGRRQQWLAS